MRATIKIFTAVVISSFIFGCASIPHSDKQTVTRLANAAFQKAGFQLSEFQPPQVHYATGLHEWLVTYDTKALLLIAPDRLVSPTKPDMPYGILIFVDDCTGEVDMAHNQPSDIPQAQVH
jgi:hypothetical protein